VNTETEETLSSSISTSRYHKKALCSPVPVWRDYSSALLRHYDAGHAFCILRTFFYGEGTRSKCYGPTAALRLIVQTYDEGDYFFFSFFLLMEHMWNAIDRGKPKYSAKACSTGTLSTSNPTWTLPGSNPDLRSESAATNRPTHGTAHSCDLLETKHEWQIKRVWKIWMKIQKLILHL
jgi:hypothetical protein